MKKLTMLTAAALAAGIMLTGCSAADGKVSDKRDSRADNAVTSTSAERVREDSSSQRRTVTTTRRVETSRNDSRPDTDMRDSETLAERTDSAAGRMKDKAESLADDAKDKADEISDDVADGINGGLDAAESLVDDVLR